MAQLINGQVKLDNGQIVTPQVGGWYDGQQFWGGTLSEKGAINTQSNQPGAGQMVSREVVNQTDAPQGLKPGTNWEYLHPSTPGVAGAMTPGTATATTPGVVSETQKQIDELNAQIKTKTDEANKRKAEVNENPFLSEASRVGRIAKIDSFLNDSLQSDQTALARLTAKQTAETEAATPSLDIQYITDDSGNVTMVSVDKKSGKQTQTSLGKIGNAEKGSTGVTENTANQKAQAQLLIASYVTDKNAQTSLSPEEYVMKIMAEYPLAGITIDTASEIRTLTGQ